MGRKWTNMKFEFEDRTAPVRQASANPQTQQEVVNEYITHRWDEDNIPVNRHIDVMFGNFSTEKIKQTVSDFFNEFAFLKRAAVVFVTDSANIGYGWVFERNKDGGAELIEEYTGYENARGHDVTGEISDDYGLRVNADWYWD